MKKEKFFDAQEEFLTLLVTTVAGKPTSHMLQILGIEDKARARGLSDMEVLDTYVRVLYPNVK